MQSHEEPQHSQHPKGCCDTESSHRMPRLEKIPHIETRRHVAHCVGTGQQAKAEAAQFSQQHLGGHGLLKGFLHRDIGGRLGSSKIRKEMVAVLVETNAPCHELQLVPVLL